MYEFPPLVLSHTSLDFPEQQKQTTSAPRNISLSYWGEATFTVTSATFIGTHADQFVLNVASNFLPTVMNHGEFLNLPIAFAPTSIGAKQAQLVITHQLGTSTIDLVGNCIDNSFNDFPFVYDFTPTTFPPTGWLNRSGWLPASAPIATTALSTTGQWNRNNFVNTAAHPFGGAARINNSGTTGNGWLITPLIDLDSMWNVDGDIVRGQVSGIRYQAMRTSPLRYYSPLTPLKRGKVRRVIK
jgi:hypothetical protein